MAKTKDRISEWTRVFIILAAVLCTAIFVYIRIEDNISVEKARKDTGFSVVTDYVCSEVADDNSPIGIIKEYTFTIDNEMDRDVCLAFYTVHQYARVYIDNECVYNLNMPEGKHIGKTVGNNWSIIPLNREDAGKTVTVEIVPVYENFRNRAVEFLIGEKQAIYSNRLSKDFLELLLSMLTVFVGIILIGMSLYYHIKSNYEKRLISLGIFSVMIGIWRLTDTRFTPFLFPNHPVLVYFLSLSMLMLGMIPLSKWIGSLFSHIFRRIIDIYCMLSAAVYMIQVVLQCLNLYDLRETLVVTHFLIVIGIIILLFAAIYERIKYPDSKGTHKERKLSFICIAGVIADVVLFYLRKNSAGLLFSLLGFLVYIVILGIANVIERSEQERKLAEKDRQLAELSRTLMDRRIAVMMSQIRSHFIFNVLTAISGYCKTNPKKADSILIRFARYLRKNIRIIEIEGLIDFCEELEQVEDYVALEQVRFEDLIEFEMDIGVKDFKLPPLTIQPLVENAIKHGLVKHNRKGIIRLTTELEDGYIKITVSDNGVGFDTKAESKPDSVGIRNVSFRLQNMVDGRLEMESVLGEGTRAIIYIPIKDETNTEEDG